MKRKFTFLIAAALMLLTMISQPTRLWGQTRAKATLTNANIVAAGSAADSYQSWSITDDNSKTWNAYAIKKAHSGATSAYHYLQIKKYASSTAYYIQVPEYGTKITQLKMTVSSTSKPMDGGGNSATLYFSSSNSTSSTGTGVASGTGASSITIDCSSLNLNTGYITASAGIRIWDVEVTYNASHTITYSATNGNISGVDDSSNAVASGASIAEGATVTLTAEPAGGYTFSSWEVSGTGASLSSTTTNPTTFTMGTANATVTANFVAAGGNYITVTPATATPNCAAQYVDFSIDTDQSLEDDPTVFYTTSEGTSSTTAPDWINEVLYDDGTLTVEIKQNKTSSARTAYFRVQSATVQSDVITITQAAFTLPAPSFDPESGAVFLNEDVVLLESDTTGATIYYTMGATPADPTTSSLVYDPEEGIVVNESTTIKAIAVKYNISSAVATANYTVVNPLTTMDAIFTASATTNSYYVTLGNWVVSGVTSDSKTAYITDNAGKGFIAYYSSGSIGFAVGDVLSNTVQLSLKRYNGAAESTNLYSGTSGLGKTTGGTITPITNKTIADLSGVCTGGVYTLSGLTYDADSKLLSDGVYTIKPYNQLYSGMSFTDEETYNVTGVYLQYNSTKEILPRSSADIVVAPGVTASVTSISDFTYNVGSGPDAKSFTVAGANLTDDITVSTNSENFEISSDNSNWQTSDITISKGSGTVAATTIHVRLKSGLDSNTYNGKIIVSSDGADDKEIALTGTVTHVIAYNTSLPTGCSVNSEPNGAQVAGESVSLTATAGDGYKFSTWDVYKTGEESTKVIVTDNAFTMPAYNVTVSATFVPAYTVTYVANGGSGTMTDENSPYIEGAQVTLLSNTFTYAGHTWSSWSVKDASQNDVEVSEGKFTMPSSAVTVTAQWTTNTHDITMPAEDTYGRYTASEKTGVEYDAEVELTYTPASGYEHYVAVWSVNGTPIDGNTFNMPDEDVIVTVTTHATWTVTYNANGGTGSMSDPNSPYVNGANVTVLANGFTYINHTFVKWNTQANGEGIDYAPGATISGISANVTLYAQWENGSHVTYTITSTSAVSTSGSAPLGSSATYSSTYGTNYQLTNGNSMTLRLTGYSGQIIKKITLSMHSNGSGGSGNMNMNIGETSYASIATAAFNTSSWNNAYTTNWVNIQRNASPNDYVVKAGEDIVITIAATANSLFCRSFTIDYETSSEPMVMVSPTTQTVNHEAQSITTGDKIFNLYSLNIDSPTFELAYCDEDGNILGSNPYSSWFTPAVTDNNKVTYSVTANTGGDRTAYFKVYATVVGDPVYSDLCSLTQKHQPYTYTLVDGSTVTLEAGKHYIITSGTSGTVYAMGYQKSNNRDAVSVSFTGAKINETEDVYEFVISGDNTNNWTIYDIANSKYLYASSSSSNNLNIQETNDANGQWAISISEDVASIVAQGTNSRKVMQFNSTLFSCYASASQSSVYLYKRDGDTDLEFYSPTTLASATIAATETYTVESGQILEVTGTLTNNGTASNLIIEDGGQLITSSAVNATIQKDVTGYGRSSSGWKLIASPVTSNLNVAENTNLTTGSYDLYFLDQSQPNKEWRNYKANTFTIDNEKGYLYANNADITIEFSGELKASNEDVTIDNLPFTSGNRIAGYNLIGNPFPCNAYSSMPYYAMNAAGDDFVSKAITVAIPPCTGVVVTATTTGQSVTFSKNAPEANSNNGNLNIVLSEQVNERGEAKTHDNAIISFNEGSQLAKFVFNENNAKIYIPQNGKDYAVTTSNGQGEMPVNFKAAQNGTYTLSIEAENVEMDYMHLIDNMTGADVDLLQTPSYSFTSKTTDYASRFRLVFSANSVNDDSTNSETFAFINGEEIVITNAEADATLQVVDMTGRILVNTKGANRLSTAGMTPGVYVIRMVNGEKVKTQKIVVR